MYLFVLGQIRPLSALRAGSFIGVSRSEVGTGIALSLGMPSIFAAWISLSTLLSPVPGVTPADLFAPAPAIEQDLLGDLVAQFDGIPVPVVDPFQQQVMVEVRGTW